MGAERIDGIKYHLDREPVDVLSGIHNHLLERHRRLVDDISKVSGELAVRGALADGLYSGSEAWDQYVEHVVKPMREAESPSPDYEQLDLLGERPEL